MFGRNAAMFGSKEAGNRWTWTVLLCSETDDPFRVQFQFPSAHFVFRRHQKQIVVAGRR